MLPNDVRERVEVELGVHIQSAERIGGGCIANATKLETPSGTCFLKWSRDDAALTFEAEAEGLRALREADTALHIPKPIAVVPRRESSPGLLILEWIERGTTDDVFWERFGRDLADLHHHTADEYGFKTANFIGRLRQVNDRAESWPAFFWSRRIEPQVRMAHHNGRWKSDWNGPLDALSGKLADILPERPAASILHGDLWGGNFIPAADGRAALVDPAAYFGDRAADLAMTRLFGGFSESFYRAYQEAWPLEPGWEDRFEIYNLYHLINHLNHFGGGYAASVERILKRYGS